ncbi:MAG: hypothetical protein M3R70_10535 [Actinomycetota bacterium]|nr:hypothetical protein [Actinomycetota bacterium]
MTPRDRSEAVNELGPRLGRGAAELEQLRLPVKIGPDEQRELMDLYPQPRGRETGVEYMPGPGPPPGRETRRRRSA